MNNHFRIYHTCTELKDNINTDSTNDNSICRNDNFSPIPYLAKLSGQYNHLKRDSDHMDRLEKNSFKKTKLTNSIDEDNYISQYFTDEIKEKGKGICGLVGNAFKQTD